jgi:trehalose/maltose transport system substrate-binding protein
VTRAEAGTIARGLGIALFLSGAGCARPAAEPVSVTFLDVEWEAPDHLPALARDIQEFTKETGIQVKRLPAPDGTLNQLALWRESLQRGAAAPDVCGIDVIWSALLEPYLIDLRPHFADELSSRDPVMVASYTVGDKLVAVPHHAYVGVLFYRADLLHRYGYREPPRTWDELEAMAARIQAGERARGEEDFWGYVWQGAGEDLTCGGLEWQMGEGGGRIIEDDKTITVNNPKAMRAWQRAARWVGTISPPAVVAHGKWDAENLWASGKAAFHRGWASDFNLITQHTPPADATQFGVTSVPSGGGGRASTLGGNGLAVSRVSAHSREALELVRFLRGRDARLMRATEHSDLPKELELFEQPSILAPYPAASESRRRGAHLVARPSIVAAGKYEEVTRAYGRHVHSVLTREKTPAAAAAALEAELVAITGFAKGPPRKDR